MTRTHASAYTAPEDPFAHARCANCPHFVSAGAPVGRPCQYAAEGCPCTDHKLLAIEGGEES
jgi:hypothetical protein